MSKDLYGSELAAVYKRILEAIETKGATFELRTPRSDRRIGEPVNDREGLRRVAAEVCLLGQRRDARNATVVIHLPSPATPLRFHISRVHEAFCVSKDREFLGLPPAPPALS